MEKKSKEGRRTYRPKRCGNNNKDEENSPKTLNDKNHQASSKKFRQRIEKVLAKPPDNTIVCTFPYPEEIWSKYY